MEKTGTLELTQEDLSLFLVGVVSDKLVTNWGLNYQSLKEAIDSGNYKVVDLPHNNS